MPPSEGPRKRRPCRSSAKMLSGVSIARSLMNRGVTGGRLGSTWGSRALAPLHGRQSRRATAARLRLQRPPTEGVELTFPFTHRRFAHTQFLRNGNLRPLTALQQVGSRLAAFSHLCSG